MDYEKEIPFGAFDSELMHQEISIPEGFTATIKGDKVILTKTENEDERIRKRLIDFFEDWRETKSHLWGINVNKILAWLEKQGQTFTKKDVDDAYLKGICDAKHELEKQDEKEPADKVEPKFKVGEWVVFNNKHEAVYQIEKIENFQYTIRHILGGSMPLSFSHEDMIRAWTIEDAKDGDVVVDKSDGTIGIFQSIGHHPDGGSYNDPSYCFLHCRYDDGFFYADFENGNTIDSDDLIPATKSQRDTLFAKMHEAGYMWDSESKQLLFLKAEPRYTQNTSWLEKQGQCQVKESAISQHENKTCKENNDSLTSKDDMMIEETLYFLREYQQSNRCKDESGMQNSVSCEKWLKSLKERIGG